MVFHVRATFRIELKGGRVIFYKQRGRGQEFWCPKISRGAKDQQGRVNAPPPPPPLNAALHVNVYVCVSV